MTLYTIAITLILVMDPLGNIPVFLAILRNYDTRTQTRIILRESLIAFLILALFVFFGHYILHGLHITTPALSIAGGVILFIIALRMIFPPEQKAVKEDFEEPLIVPLAVPLTAGPSAMAMVLLFVTRDPHHLWLVFLGVLIASAIFTVIMLFAPFLMKILGKRGLTAIERLMGMILTTIAVQMFLSGVAQYLHYPLM
ncbi:MarC family protein [Coxiella-like endosymbiont]|uniref:MarC family protein n=1 Tax=Coxiella-like endosymbiont TaxID=1592897 RepID=UPI00272B2C83|nr:MarC family protein [Coxiella-like endosymbiont]